MKILTIDIGGSHIKTLATGQSKSRTLDSGNKMTPEQMSREVQELVKDWEYEVVSLGVPGLVGTNGPVREPVNLGPGWVGFDYAAAFARPIKIINDAAMQALGSHQGGRMLFLGLGTSLGSALICGKVIVVLELGQLPYDAQYNLEQALGRKGLERLGQEQWERAVHRVVPILAGAFVADYVVIGGGQAKRLTHLPPDTRRGGNEDAFLGGFRLWAVDAVPTQPSSGGLLEQSPSCEAWLVL